MIYLSVQPSEYYFTWQLEIQLYNFKKLGIKRENIHVLIGYDYRSELPYFFKELIEKSQDTAMFYIYPDKREKKNYASSIRPHLIHQHFIEHRWLEKEIVFYHDADIIFKELPDFTAMIQHNTWYVSDTREYLDSTYIRQFLDEETFASMCELLNFSPSTIIENDPNCGGAQYLLKNVPAGFWRKMENDCEILYIFLSNYNTKKEIEFKTRTDGIKKYAGIQAWCTDMWCLFWNALYFNYPIKISKELDFSWATSSSSDWSKTKILHYTGHVAEDDKNHFRKLNYLNYTPFFDLSLKLISKNSASYALKDIIEDYNRNKKKERIDFKDVSFLIPVRIDSESRLENLYLITNYIDKYFDASILIAESDSTTKIDKEFLPSSCKHYFIEDNSELLHHTKINNFLILKANTSIVVIYDTDVVFPINQLEQSANLIRGGIADMVAPYDGCFVDVDSMFKVMFGKFLDPFLFTINYNKFSPVLKHSWGGCAFLSKVAYKKAGLENEFISSWGPEDIERPKRLKNLGYKVKRVNGPLYHLPHERKINSSYYNADLYYLFMGEYLKICSMHKPQLEDYIKTWPWVN